MRRWPLWLQLTSAMLGVSVVVALAAGEMMRAIETDYLQDELRRESQRTSQAITLALTGTVASQQFGDLETVVGQLDRDDAFIHSVALLDGNGRTLSRWVRPAEAPPGAVVYFRTPSQIPGAGEGQLVVSWNIASLQRSIQAHVDTLRVNMIVTVAVLGVLLVALVHYLVMRPVNVLARGLDRLARGDAGTDGVLSPLAALELDRLARSVGELGRYQLALRDAQSSLEEARREAEAASDAKGRFLAVMSHEIRTPLNGVVGSLELLEDAGLERRERGMLHNAQRSVDSLLEIINEILDFSRIEAGGIELEDVDFQLEAHLNDVATSVAALVAAKQVELVVDFDPALPGRVRADPLRLRQVVTNLLGNAVKFTTEGCIVLAVQRLGEERMRIEVSDTGIGIPEAQQATLFNPFTQADSSTSRRFGGTGLGLSICKQLVELMGGTIGIESWPGQGSTFWFEVPLVEVEPPRNFDDAGLRGLRALVVEADPFVAKAVEAYLASMGLETANVANLENASAWMQGRMSPVRFIVVDGRVLKESAREHLAAVRELGGDQDIRTIAMVAPGQVAPSWAADTLVLKPVRRSDLLTAMLDEPVGAEEEVADAELPTPGEPVRSRVLVVDDNPMNLQVASAMLERLNLEVHGATGGAEALALLDRMRFDVILMDEQMPEMDGLEATRRIRARDSEDAATPVIALTANADHASEQRCLGAGMDAFMPKPVRRRALRGALSRWLPALREGTGEAGRAT